VGGGVLVAGFLFFFSVVVVVVAVAVEAVVMAPGGRNKGTEAESELDCFRAVGIGCPQDSLLQSCRDEGAGLDVADEWGSLVSFSRFRRGHSETQDG
jgi:hypothetical protein